jgi:tetratricopeptide (TPR) repeat protein
MLANNHGNYSEAAQLYNQSLALLKELGDKSGVATSLHQLGILAHNQSNYSEAARLYQESLGIKRELGDKSGVAASLHQLGILAQGQGDNSEATRLCKESLEIAKELGDKSGIASSLHELGNLQFLHGNYMEAARFYRESLNIKKELGDKSGVANSLGQLGRLARAQGEMKEALTYFLGAFITFEELHQPHRQMALKDIASVRNAVGNEQLSVWLRELTTDAERITRLLEQNERDDEQRAKEFVAWLANGANAVVAARKQRSAEEQRELAHQLGQAEVEAREQNVAEVAEFFAVLRALLVGEDVGERIAALPEPMGGIAEGARAACEADGWEEG